MTTLVTPPAGSAFSADQLATAEALVAAQMNMPQGLREREGVGESGEIGSSGLIALSCPAVSIQSLTLAGAPAMGILKNPWTVDVSGLVRPYLTGGFYGTTYARLPYTITYTSGWTAETLPEGIRQAILATAELGAAVPVGVTSERMGPVAYTYASGALSADVLTQLRPWLPLRY